MRYDGTVDGILGGGNVEEIDHVGYLGINERITLERGVLKKKNEKCGQYLCGCS